MTELPSTSQPASERRRATSTASQWRAAFSLREMGVYYALALIVVALAFITSYLGQTNYLSFPNLTNVIYQASLTSILAISMTIILITGNFDLSIASVGALAAAILITLSDSLGFLPAAAIAMMVSVSIGLFNGIVVQLVGVNAFIVTLGTLTAVRGLVLIYTGASAVYAKTDASRAWMTAFVSGDVPIGYPVFFLAIGIAIWGAWRLFRDVGRERGVRPEPVLTIIVGLILMATMVWNHFDITVEKPVIYMIFFLAITWWVLNQTYIGRRVYAVGSNPEAARLSGIDVVRYKIVAFVLSGATAGFAGILFASDLRSMNLSALQGTELTVIASAILGGTSLFGGKGSVVKSVAGALLLYSLNNGFNIANLGANYQGFVEGVVIISAAAIYTVGGSSRAPRRS